MALDGNGDPVYVPKDQSFSVGDGCEEIPSRLWVLLCGTTKSCAPRTATCASDDDEPTSPCTRERDGYEIRVVSKAPECACGFTDPDKYVPLKENVCKCVNPDLPFYKDHYEGKCGCHCDECGNCDAECILLARLDKPDANKDIWRIDHRVRRFIRPVLMRDRQVEIETPSKLPTQTQNVPKGSELAQAPSEAEAPDEVETALKATIVELPEKIRNATAESDEVTKRLNEAADEKVKLEQQLAGASESERQAMTELLKVKEEKIELEKQLLKAVQEKKEMEERLLQLADKKSVSPLPKKTPKGGK